MNNRKMEMGLFQEFLLLALLHHGPLPMAKLLGIVTNAMKCDYSYGSAHVSLTRLKNKGMVSTNTKDVSKTSNGKEVKDRVFYNVTKKGEKALQDMESVRDSIQAGEE